MGVRLYENKHFLCARWGKITIEDLDRVLARAKHIHQHEGRKLVYAGVQHEDTPLPDRDATRLIIERGMELSRLCDRFSVVVAASGITGSLHRTGIRSMLTLARMAGADVARVRVYDSIGAMLEDNVTLLPASITQLSAALFSAAIA